MFDLLGRCGNFPATAVKLTPVLEVVVILGFLVLVKAWPSMLNASKNGSIVEGMSDESTTDGGVVVVVVVVVVRLVVDVVVVGAAVVGFGGAFFGSGQSSVNVYLKNQMRVSILLLAMSLKRHHIAYFW